MTDAHDPRTLAGVAHVARLSRLALSQGEAEAMLAHMGRILEWVDELNELDTSGVSASLHDDAIEPLRGDEPVASLSPAAALANAPQRNDEGFVVPTVVSE